MQFNSFILIKVDTQCYLKLIKYLYTHRLIHLLKDIYFINILHHLIIKQPMHN